MNKNYCSQHTSLTLTGVRYVDSLYKAPLRIQRRQMLDGTLSQSYDESDILSKSSQSRFNPVSFSHSSISSDEELLCPSKKMTDNNSGVENDPLKTTGEPLFHSAHSELQMVGTQRRRKSIRRGKFEDPSVNSKNPQAPETIEQDIFESNIRGSDRTALQTPIREPSRASSHIAEENQNLKKQNLRLRQLLRIQPRPESEKAMPTNREGTISSRLRRQRQNKSINSGILTDELMTSQIEDSFEKAPLTASNRLQQITQTSINSRATKPKARNSSRNRPITQQELQFQEGISQLFQIPEIQVDFFPMSICKSELRKIASRLFLKFNRVSIPDEEINVEIETEIEGKIIKKFTYDEENNIEWDSQGNFYIGRSRNSVKEGTGFEIVAGKEKYMGQFQEGLRHGKGRVRKITGEEYVGDWSCGLREGFGEEKDIQGNTYQGQWKSDKRHGAGIITNAKGEFFKGKFEAGMKHGYGEWQEYLNGKGDTYKGNYIKGKRHGYGEYYYSDSGNVFKGYFRNGIIHIRQSERKSSIDHLQQRSLRKARPNSRSLKKQQVNEQPELSLPPINRQQSSRPFRGVSLRQNSMSIFNNN